ncbi:Prolyl aminopeptidase [Handroanthus impetiginosus]|uniref:Prolyl aminopeptidase n=1 Tax=Handroanthus impetiginosus TaxID=429701 RepID=A0A2G9HSA9_9LAMI|nr:Prolyl aminopeptidase [Handroanthus impetiginosus]
MRALRALLSLLTPLRQPHLFYSCRIALSSSPPLTRVYYLHSSSRPISKITSMANNTTTSAASANPSDSKHIIGDWFSVPELRLRDHRFTVPLDYSDAASPKISLFVREVVAVGKEELHLPFLLYLQGGPG